MTKITVFNKKKHKVDMTSGPLFSKMIRFVVPLIISGIFQLLFHAADLIVVGKFASHKALAAVGATASLTFLLINIFIGMSVGTNVLVARYIGEKNSKETSRTVHTSILASVICGIILAVGGIVFASPALKLMGTPEDIFDMAVLYMWICFAGMPLMMLYNFGSAIMRAIGDTTRPFWFLIISGTVNVCLNLFFVICFHWDVAGVALATVISQGVSAYLVLNALAKMHGACRFKWQMLRLEWKNLKEIIFIGVPAGVQSSCFSASNLLIQSSINTFGSMAVAGITAAGTIEAFAFVTNAVIGQAAISFVSQNFGAKNIARVKKSISICMFMAYACSFLIAFLLLFYRYELLCIFSDNDAVIEFGVERFWITLPFIFICAIMEVINGSLRGLGHSLLPTLITIFFICVMRVIWIYTAFRWNPTMRMLFASYPLTWILNTIGVFLLLRYVLRKIEFNQADNA